MSAMSFEHPFFLLLLAPLLWLGWQRLRARPATVQISSLRVAKQVPASLRTRIWWLPDALFVLAIAVLVVAMARPQRVDQELLSGEGIDIMIALDMSGSMNAIDATQEEIERIQAGGEEPLNRFGTARRILKEFIRHRAADRVGLVIFGAEAYLRFPPTLDYVRLLNALDGLVLDDGRRMSAEQADCLNGCTISGSGTAIGDAVNRAFLRLEQSKSRSKMLILITDGKQEGGSMDPLTVPKYVASLPEKERVRMYTFLVGSGRDSRLPVTDPLRGTLLRDRFGRIVYQRPDRPFPTDPELLRQIAELTGGRFYQSYDPQKFEADFKDLERTTFEVKVHTSRRELFFGWLLAGLGLLAVEQLLRRTWLARFPG
jgi:Ca-activated chloride channel family protein